MSRSMDIYRRLPVPLQEAAISAKGVQFRLQRQSDLLLQQNLAFLRNSWTWTIPEIEDYQNLQLRRVIASSFATVHYYRQIAQKFNLSPIDFKTTDDLVSLPVLAKSAVRGNERQFCIDSMPFEKMLKGSTSGSTGTPMSTYETRTSLSRRFAFVSRLREFGGVSDPVHTRRCQFTGRDISNDPVAQPEGVYWRRNRVSHSLLLSTSHLTAKTALKYAAAMRNHRPEVIDGYPSAIALLARWSLAEHFELPQPKMIITSAETLLPEDVAVMEQAFRARVYDQYAATEATTFWCTCRFGVMHVNEEAAVCEFLDADGHSAPAGQAARIVTTNLYGSPMRLIRYDTGDMATLSDRRQCECGSNSRQIESIEGRREDVLFVPDRGAIGRLDPTFKGLSAIVECQIEQVSLSELVVRYVPAPDFSPGILQQLESNLREKVGRTIAITFQEFQQIPRGANGKLRAVVRNSSVAIPQ